MGMPRLTRRREKDRHQEWHVFFDDVQVGTISERAGVPVEVDQWGWHCGFAPVIDRGLRAGGTSATFEKARRLRRSLGARLSPPLHRCRLQRRCHWSRDCMSHMRRRGILGMIE